MAWVRARVMYLVKVRVMDRWIGWARVMIWSGPG